jgi:tripartite-type tricarboxylate transporter receptor subunit TctC
MIRFPFRNTRRTFSVLAGLSGLSVMMHARAQKSSWPTKPVRLVVAFPPGGLADVLSRLIHQQLGEALGQPVIIENRAGAGGNVAGTEVAHNGGDGHTFLVTISTTESVNPSMFARMPFDPQKDLQPVALLANSQLFMITRPTLAPSTLAEFVEHAKAHPDTLNYGSGGNGTTIHLAGELLKQNAGITATHVPYKGVAPAIKDVMAGQIDFTFAPGTVFPTVKAGRLKMLAVASRARATSVPGVPTFTEQGIDNVYADSRFGIYAPASVPAETIGRMNREINRILGLPAVKARFVELGAEALPFQPLEYKAMVQEETRLFADIVKVRKLTAD